jgi:hypothetical protein
MVKLIVKTIVINGKIKIDLSPIPQAYPLNIKSVLDTQLNKG